MKNLSLTLLAFLMLAGLYSCEEPVESINRDPGEVSYLPMKIGDNWVFERKIIDTNGNITDYEKPLYDSAVVRGLALKGGRDSKLMSFYGDFINAQTKEINRIPFRSLYFTPSGNDLLLFSDFVNTVKLNYEVKENDSTEVQNKEFVMNFPVGEQWIPLVNARTGAETIITKDTMVVRVEVPVYTDPNKTQVLATYARGKATVEVKPEGSSSISAAGKSFNANKYTITVKFEGNPISEAGLEKDIPFVFTSVQSYWFGEGTGLLKFRIEPVNIRTNIGGTPVNYIQTGSESTIIRGTYIK